MSKSRVLRDSSFSSSDAKDCYRLVAVDKVTLGSVRREVREGRAYCHYWQAPTNKRYLVRCTIDRFGKHFRVVAVSGKSSMGFTWLPVAHYERTFI